MNLGNICPGGSRHIAIETDHPERFTQVVFADDANKTFYKIAFCKKCAAAFLDAVPMPPMKICPACNGTGSADRPQNGEDIRRTCRLCEGRKEVLA